jgi:hypothetical protein
MSSGEQTQLRLYAGHAKIAAILGVDYEVYPFTFDDPTASGKSTGRIKFAVAADPNFSAPLKYNKAVWIAYADGNLLNVNDILVGPYGTFYIGDKQPMQPMQAVRANRLVNIGRGEYSTSGPIVQSVVNYTTGLPIFMQFTREDIQKAATTVATTQLGRAITHWDAFIPATKDSIKQDDVVTDEAGLNYVIDAPNFTNLGYVCHMRLASV